ncbi:MAG: hypothetical protein WDN28_10075 [Chthoniobacter sp.]
MLLVPPEFDRVRFSGEAFQRGGILKNGQPAAREEWDAVLGKPETTP